MPILRPRLEAVRNIAPNVDTYGNYSIPLPCHLYLGQVLYIYRSGVKPTDLPFPQNTKPYIKFTDNIIYETLIAGK